MAFDELERMLIDLKGDMPKPHSKLTPAQKRELVEKVGGVLTVKAILKAADSLPRERIPFLFSSIDTQAVVDVLGNDMRDIVAEFDKPGETAKKAPARKAPPAKKR